MALSPISIQPPRLSNKESKMENYNVEYFEVGGNDQFWRDYPELVNFSDKEYSVLSANVNTVNEFINLVGGGYGRIIKVITLVAGYKFIVEIPKERIIKKNDSGFPDTNNK